MRIGLIGVGAVGGTLKKYFETKTSHVIVCHDPAKGLNDSFEGVEAVFIAVPVPAIHGAHLSHKGVDDQDLRALKAAVEFAQTYTEDIYVRSTVLPGTNDMLGTTAMPEFLTERTAFEDMCRLPILCGRAHKNLRVDKIFPEHEIFYMSNVEAELAKFTHNCFGAMKVTYFNIVHATCEALKADFETVKKAAMITGFINEPHTQVPGPDGQFGYGGKCFPENISAFINFFARPKLQHVGAFEFFKGIEWLNWIYRQKRLPRPKVDNFEGRA